MSHLKSVMLTVACLAACTVWNASAAGQYQRMGYQGKLPVARSIDSLQDELSLGSPAQRKDLFLRLGMDRSEAAQAAGNATVPVTRLERWRGTGASLLFTGCDDPLSEFATLALMQPGKEQAWRVVDSRSFSCWREKVTEERIFVPGPAGNVVLVHHANAGHGSGYVGDDMLLLGMRGHRLVTLLKTQEYLSEDSGNSGTTLIQRSTLQPFPDGRVQETRATYARQSMDEPAPEPEQIRLVKVERRWWRWKASAQNFAAGSFRMAGQ